MKKTLLPLLIITSQMFSSEPKSELTKKSAPQTLESSKKDVALDKVTSTKKEEPKQQHAHDSDNSKSVKSKATEAKPAHKKKWFQRLVGKKYVFDTLPD